jgi:hypothetical protein
VRPVLLALLLLSACAASPAVRVRTEDRQGWGCVVDQDRVLTPYHVVEGCREIRVEGLDGWAPARVARTVPADPQDLVELETAAPLPEPVRLRRPRHGDSGTPLLVEGEAVGLLLGEGVFLGLGPAARGGAVIVRRP